MRTYYHPCTLYLTILRVGKRFNLSWINMRISHQVQPIVSTAQLDSHALRQFLRKMKVWMNMPFHSFLSSHLCYVQSLFCFFTETYFAATRDWTWDSSDVKCLSSGHLDHWAIQSYSRSRQVGMKLCNIYNLSIETSPKVQNWITKVERVGFLIFAYMQRALCRGNSRAAKRRKHAVKNRRAFSFYLLWLCKKYF